MTFHAFLAYLSALLSSGLVIFVLCARRRTIVHWSFASGMSAIALMEAFMGLRVQAVVPADAVYWKSLSYLATALLPGSWLLFSLSFGRSNYRELIARWKYVLIVAFACPLALVVGGRQALLADLTHVPTSAPWLLPLAWAGYLFHLFLLLSDVVILMHLERTLLALVGSTRWQIKFIVLGLGAFFAAQIYTSSQALLFSSVEVSIESIQAYAVIIADCLIIVSLRRNRHFNVNIYLSRTLLQSSITVLIVGIYLLTVGLLTKAINYFGSDLDLPLGTFFVFLALVGLTIVLLSDELRHYVKRFISRHFYRSYYDYRQEWTAFTERTAMVVHVKDLCTIVCTMLSETFGVPSVTIWLVDEEMPAHVTICGSTAFSDTAPYPPEMTVQGTTALVQCLREHPMPVDFETASDPQALELRQAYASYLRAAQIRYGVSLVAGQQWLGLISLSDRHTKDTFTLEDCDLLKTMADQTAVNLLNLQLLQRVVHAKQMETFQALSAFFVHDLKNLAAKLSLMVQNLPVYYDNPEFRDDALHVIAGSVAKMNAMCGRLSLLTRELELQRTEVDLNELVQTTLTAMNGSLKGTLTHIPGPVPRLLMDPEQMQKVLENLLLNAHEAMDTQGEIRVETTQQDSWAVLTVSDNGCGMSRAFMEQSLFHPFQTTKSQGLGIGLFHSRTIVEAHHGRIEVESEEGRGSAFRVLLPVKG
jgi:putative PEP-CTERM system histidine kinase